MRPLRQPAEGICDPIRDLDLGSPSRGTRPRSSTAQGPARRQICEAGGRPTGRWALHVLTVDRFEVGKIIKMVIVWDEGGGKDTV